MVVYSLAEPGIALLPILAQPSQWGCDEIPACVPPRHRWQRRGSLFRLTPAAVRSKSMNESNDLMGPELSWAGSGLFPYDACGVIWVGC